MKYSIVVSVVATWAASANALAIRATTTTTSTSAASTSTYYVATTGSDSNPGTITSPFLTIQKAVNVATPGYTIHIRGGTYKPTTNIQIAKNGTSSQPYVIQNYASEKVIVDGEDLPGTPAALDASLPNAQRGVFHIERANYWKLIGLEIINGPYGVYSRDASYNTYSNLITHDNYESGLQIQGAASYNQVINLDSYRNRDPRKNGESADGLAIKEGSGTGNVVRGARLWDNVDDGLDFWMFTSPITVENSHSWANGFNRWGFSNFAGDGNGFKLGGGNADVAASHTFKNCIAFANAQGGFIDNTQKGNHVISRNTAFHNGGSGFDFEDSTPSVTGNIAVYNNPNTKLSGGSSSGNSWNSGTWSNSTFISVSTSVLTGPRNADGSIPGSNFLIPTSGAAIGATTWV